ncbi:MAG TPA: hypothetical protein VMR77_02915 [Patescibacteria group bacterium]|nr:hypothetical protein [Patescibacteria group bacterium]
MFTLSQASYDTKEILKWGGLFIAGLVVIVVFIQMFLLVKEAIFPTPPPKPTVAFGKLDPQLFPASATDKKLTYKINTLTGSLPSLPGQIKVFKIKTAAPDLLSLSNAKDKVGQVGFNTPPTQISDVSYKWDNTDSLGLSQEITMNIVNNNFVLTSDFLSSQSALSGDLPNEKDSITTATDYLNQINPLPTDIDTGKTKTSFLAVTNGSLAPVQSLADAKAVRIDFFQKDINNIPIVYEQPNLSNTNVLVGPKKEVLQAQYFYQTPGNESATYPIKTSAQAFDDLQKGIAYIASYGGSSTSVSITDAFPAYYLSSETQKYLMPVIVFEGSDNFTAYVPVVTDEWINK